MKISKTVISSDNRFEWDNEKNLINEKKHGLRFEEILTVFEDPFYIERFDYSHSIENEDRYLGVGYVLDLLIVVVSYTERRRIRLISARVASKKEEQIYYENRRKFISGKNN